MFSTCLNYTTLRLLGEVQKEENDGLAKGRAWILSHGTATAAPQWAKILLSVWLTGIVNNNMIFIFVLFYE
jgi:hypothetical protein